MIKKIHHLTAIMLSLTLLSCDTATITKGLTALEDTKSSDKASKKGIAERDPSKAKGNFQAPPRGSSDIKEVKKLEFDELASFNFGDGQNDGSGQFNQNIPYYARAEVGTIPKGIKDVEIKLDASVDVDVELWHGDKPIIAWPDGILNGPGPASTEYNGVTVHWSGYNGDQTTTGRGKEYIKISGITQNDFVMKVFGFQSGDAPVIYSWKGTGGVKDCGNGSFQQDIPDKARAIVGTIPKGIKNLYVKLDSPKDVDVELWHSGTPIVAWPNGILNGSSQASTDYQGVNIEWSGFNGDQTPTGYGKEYIKLMGTTQNDFIMQVYGYQPGFANVTYEWGEQPCGTNVSGVPSDIKQKFEAAQSKAGPGLGSPTSEIVRTASSTGYKQSFSGASSAGEGIIILKDGGAEAYWVHGGIFNRYIEFGGTNNIGYPTSNEETGYTSSITGHTSVYQMFDGNGKSQPSLQYVNQTGKTYLFLGGIRDFWWNNKQNLGLPTSDELPNPVRQNFEGGTVYWNEGNPSFGGFFGNPLDNVICCYNNRDLGAPSHLGAHLGQDLIASPGHKVYAIADGVVKRAKSPSDGYGAVIIIEHTLPSNSKIVSIYGHLSSSLGLQVSNGQTVSKGQLIAYIGNNAENGHGDPHLHLGIKLGPWDSTYPGYCGTGENKIYSGSDYSGSCADTSGKFVRPLTFMETVNKTGQNPYASQSF